MIYYTSTLMVFFMKISGNEIRPGTLLDYKGHLWTVTKTQHVKPGKGGAFVQTEMKDIVNGTKLNERFRSEDTVEKVRLEEDECQMLYKNGDSYTFMNMETYDQFDLDKETVGERAVFLQDNMPVKISSYEGKIVGIVLPETVICEVIEAEPVVKGQTATGSYKPAILDNGMKLMVPPHIEAGMRVVVNTESFEYVERAK